MIGRDVDKARKTLGLGEKATLREVKRVYRSLVKMHHPDKKGDASKFVEIRDAYRILTEYINSYEYSFKPEDVKKQRPLETMWDNYSQDWMWGKKDEEEII